MFVASRRLRVLGYLGLGFRVQGLGYLGVGFRVQGLGFRVWVRV